MENVKEVIGCKSVHVEPTANHFAALRYCTKTESRVAGPWTERSTFIRVVAELRPWQKVLEAELLEEPDDRKIVWYCDGVGGAGKTQFCKWMAAKHGATVLTNGATKDLAAAIPDAPRIVLVNIARTVEGRVNYGALEQLKDGLMFSAKYESKTKVFDSPHLVVFANFLPDRTSMSEDRWDVREL